MPTTSSFDKWMEALEKVRNVLVDPPCFGTDEEARTQAEELHLALETLRTRTEGDSVMIRKRKR